MTTPKTIPNNYRQLKSTEPLRKGDLYYRWNWKDRSTKQPIIYRLRGSLYGPPTAGDYRDYLFFRRRHTKVVAPARRVDPQVGVEGSAKVKKVQVEFDYPHEGKVITREVQLISLDDKYLTGLEIGARWDKEARQWKTSYQFKKFRRDRIKAGGQIYLSKFE